MVLGLIGTLTAPNGILRASPGRELRGGAGGGAGGATGGARYVKIGGDPAGPGRIFRTFSEMVRNGPPGPWDYYLGPWGALGPFIWQYGSSVFNRLTPWAGLTNSPLL